MDRSQLTGEFKLHSDYAATGDQPQAIEKLVQGLKEGNQFETLLGVTGSGKNFHHGKCHRENPKADLNKFPTIRLWLHNSTRK